MSSSLWGTETLGYVYLFKLFLSLAELLRSHQGQADTTGKVVIELSQSSLAGDRLSLAIIENLQVWVVLGQNTND